MLPAASAAAATGLSNSTRPSWYVRRHTPWLARGLWASASVSGRTRMVASTGAEFKALSTDIACATARLFCAAATS